MKEDGFDQLHSIKEQYLHKRGVRLAQSVQQWATGWTSCVRIPTVQDCPFSTMLSPVLRLMQHPIQWEAGALSSEKTWQEHAADRSPSSNAKVEKGGAIPPLPECFHGTALK